MNYLFRRYKKLRYYFLILKSANLISHSRKITSAMLMLLNSTNIKGLKTFQNKKLIYNNLIYLEFWKCQKIWSSTIISDVILSFGISINKKPIY